MFVIVDKIKISYALMQEPAPDMQEPASDMQEPASDMQEPAPDIVKNIKKKPGDS